MGDEYRIHIGDPKTGYQKHPKTRSVIQIPTVFLHNIISHSVFAISL